ncbi:DNA ligase-like domain-containing protein [Streptomyces gibsoniae]|uniref:Uncharacterized protein n=1 Tax=Streptomyces gibsoniae TaxID=3075529 RepID=A0ABU2U988_9ACTN|nr:hypothetical protein [Streptomyces sp. DSM 41699]MDT0469802.1 hypothetical protein [Streptomyces sp. DSM 41699]
MTFELLRLSGTETIGWPYQRRRAALESGFTARRLFASWPLCPSTPPRTTVREWLTWASVGMEGVGWKGVQGPREERGGLLTVTGTLTTPRTLLLGRYDGEGRFQYVGRTTTLARAAGAAVAGLLAAGRRGPQPWAQLA